MSKPLLLPEHALVPEEVRNHAIILECFVVSDLSEEPETYIISTENLECLNIHNIYIFNVETNLLNLSLVKNMFLTGKSWIATKERGGGFYISLEKELFFGQIQGSLQGNKKPNSFWKKTLKKWWEVNLLLKGKEKKEGEKKHSGLKVLNCFVLHKWLQDLAWKILAFPLQHLEIKEESHRAQNDKSVFWEWNPFLYVPHVTAHPWIYPKVPRGQWR